MVRAQDIMSYDVVSVSPTTPITVVLNLMADKKISGVPVVDADLHVIGIVTEYDLLRAITKHKLSGTASDYMREDVVTIDGSATLREINNVLLERKIRRLPVTRDEKLVGVVSRRDIVHSENFRQQLPIIWSAEPDLDADPSAEPAI